MSIADTAWESSAWTFSLSPVLAATVTFLMAVLVADLMCRLRACLLDVTRILFLADLMLATGSPPFVLMGLGDFT